MQDTPPSLMIVLDVVGGIVLGAGCNVGLHTRNQRRAQAAELVGIFSVGFLCASPERVAQEIHCRCQQHGLIGSGHLVANGLANLVLKIHVPRGPTRHGNRKHRGLAVHGGRRLNRRVQIDPARSVPEGESLDAPCGVVRLAEDIGPVPAVCCPRRRTTHLLGLFSHREVDDHRIGLGQVLGVIWIAGHHLRIGCERSRTDALDHSRAA
jgi:hypothetical protein